MESDLLKKENEFYKENEKLEQRTKELLQKVNDVMKIQDNLIRDSFRTKTELNFAKQNSFKSNTKIQQECNLEGLNKNDDANIPNTVEGMGTKSASQFYRTKIKTLQVENVRLQSEIKKKGDEVKKLQKDNQSLLEEKEKWFMSYNTAKSVTGKLESQISSLNSKLQARDSEMASMKKELEQVKKELKNANLNCNSFEVRLNRAYEENDKLKASLKTVKDEEKEAKDGYRKQINELTSTVKHIEKYKMELLNGFKKQLQLIDNLKKQKMYLETLKMSELAETEYMKILDWKMK